MKSAISPSLPARTEPRLPILDAPSFADIDRHFAGFIRSFGGGPLPALAAAFLSRNIRNGHICLDLAAAPPEDPPLGFQWPTLAQWEAAFKENRAIGGPDMNRPLVLDSGHCIYLRRYWEYEKQLADSILARCTPSDNEGHFEDMQEAAVQAALSKQFVVISGGPGTGKTTTVLKILTQLKQKAGGAPLRIALTAPTGKAAARLQETLVAKNDAANLGQGLGIQPACTLHRLLGSRRDSIYFHHNSGNPLPVDVVVVDEASMVPLTMMAKLFDALPKRARIILLGDRDQLASVEPGSVLGDIAEASIQPSSPLRGHLIELQKNYRFGNESGIFSLCNCVRKGDLEGALKILKETSRSDLASGPTPSIQDLAKKLRAPVLDRFSAYLTAASPAEALKRFSEFRILAALRVGPYGVENLNRQIEAILRSEGLISGAQNSFYAGMPILITSNDYPRRLFNGDIGILMPDPESGSLMAWFASEGGQMRSIAPARLPRHEPAFAMTVHKSQGSEFGSVLLLLPDKPTPVLTRELLYTGLTRARAKVEVWCDEPVLRAAIGNLIQRDSGLRARLA